MKLVIYPNYVFEVEVGKPGIIETNNHRFYTDLIKVIRYKKENILFKKDKVMDSEQTINFYDDVVTNPDIYISFMPKIINSVIENLADEDRKHLIAYDECQRDIILDSMYLEDMQLKLNRDFSFKGLFKSMKITPSNVTNKSPYGILKDVLNLCSKYNSKELIVLKDVFNYLTNDQVNNLIKIIAELGLYVLLLNFTDNSNSFKNVNNYFIDQDFVSWT